jgi:hypothetical protein
MKKCDLKYGMIVKYREEYDSLAMYLPCQSDKKFNDKDEWCDVFEDMNEIKEYLNCSSYDDNLKYKNTLDDDSYSRYDIMSVYKIDECGDLCLLWEREEEEEDVDETVMTIKELEEKYGIKNLKIVKE